MYPKNKIKIIFLMLFFLILNVNAQSIESLENIEILIENNISFYLDFEDKKKIDMFKIESYFYPQEIENKQKILNFYSNQNYILENNLENKYLSFQFEDNDLKNINLIRNQFLISSNYYESKVKTKVAYPILNLDESYDVYLQFDEFINLDKSIKEQASQLAEGETDLFELSVKIANWIINDINYDISTVSENPKQSSSEVFQSKLGVCREITNLFLSMTRSLGIPSRVVLGYAYTENKDVVDFVGSNWGGHAWAEILIDNQWVPFDLTYNQYGFIDSSHIILERSPFIKESILALNGRGYGFSINNEKGTIENDFKIVKMGNSVDYYENINFDLSGTENLAFDSYGYIKLDIENLNPYYKVIFLKFAKPKDINFLDDEQKMFILKPNEKKTYFINFKISDNLDKSYEYKFPFLVYNNFIQKNFTINSRYDLEKMDLKDLPINELDTIIFSDNDLELDCAYFYGLPENKLTCLIFNPNNYKIDSINFCIENDCKIESLGVFEKKEIIFTNTKDKIKLDLFSNNLNKSEEFEIKKPIFSYIYALNKSKLNLEYNIENFNDYLKLKYFENNQLKYVFNDSKDNIAQNLIFGNNTIKLELVYMDNIIQSEEFIIFVEEINLSFWQKIINFFMNFFS